jgi:hypothetical protein
MLASIGRLVEQTQASKPAIQRTADKGGRRVHPAGADHDAAGAGGVAGPGIIGSGGHSRHGRLPFRPPIHVGGAGGLLSLRHRARSANGHHGRHWSSSEKRQRAHIGSRALGQYRRVRQDRHPLMANTKSPT